MKIFLPDLTIYQIEQLNLLQSIKDEIIVEQLTDDWQSIFCKAINYPFSDLPWAQLRLAQFEANDNLKTAVCCDPVMLQLTHRGAYMIGQSQLDLSSSDSLRIVSQINEKLMDNGEQLYFINNKSWLFVSEKAYELSSLSIQQLVGKDMFNFSYEGVDVIFWKKLNMEIQMLIKEMIDYQGLKSVAIETMMNVHFYDLINLPQTKKNSFIKNNSISVCSDNDLIKTFCKKIDLPCYSLSSLNDKNSQVVIAFNSENYQYNQVISAWKEWILSTKNKNIKEACIICQDGMIKAKPKLGFLKRIFKF